MNSLSGIHTQEFTNEGQQRLALLGIMMTFPSYFMEADTNVTVTETNFGNELYNVVADGEIKTETSSALGLTGDISFKSKGLDNIETALTERAPTLPPEQQIKLKRGIATLKFLNETGTNEGEYKNLTISLNKAAQVLVNGINLDTIIAKFTNLKVEAEAEAKKEALEATEKQEPITPTDTETIEAEGEP